MMVFDEMEVLLARKRGARREWTSHLANRGQDEGEHKGEWSSGNSEKQESSKSEVLTRGENERLAS